MEEMLGGGAAKPKAKSAIKERASIFEKKAGGGFYTQEITSKKVDILSDTRKLSRGTDNRS